MWRDHPFSQRNKTTKGAVRVELEATEKGWLDNILKWGGVGNIRAGGLHKIEELITLRQLANNDRGIHKRYEKIAKRITLI